MAQKTEKEEAEFKVGVVSESSLSLCINNCGFTGTPATKDMCQKCFNATSTSTTSSSSSSSISAADILTKFSPEKSVRSTASLLLERSDSASEARCEAAEKVTITRSRTSAMVAVVAEREMKEESTIFCRERTVNRCSGCRRKVGLTGFRCRCGDLYCSEHRYSDRHECSYDYKAAGREAIEKENPVVKAAKIIKV